MRCDKIQKLQDCVHNSDYGISAWYCFKLFNSSVYRDIMIFILE